MGLPTPPRLPSGHPGPPDGPPDFLDLLVDISDLRVGLPTHPGPPDWLLTPPVPQGGTSDNSQTSGWASQHFPDLRVDLPSPHGPRVGLTTSPRPLCGPPEATLTSWVASRPLPVLLVGPPTPPAAPGGPPNSAPDLRMEILTPLGPPGGRRYASRTSGWACQPIPYLRMGLPTPLVPSNGPPVSP